MKNVLICSALVLCCLACEKYANADIAGEWRALSLTEAGDSLAVDLSAIRFTFTEDGRYQFKSTLDYKEAGQFRLDGPYLFSTDTLQPPLREKAVEITYLSADTLELRMKELGKERLMLLEREQ